MSTVSEFTLGRSRSTLRPSGSASMASRQRGREGPAVVSPSAATMSVWVETVRKMGQSIPYHCLPPRRGFARDMRPDPTARNAFSSQLSGICPGYAGSGLCGMSGLTVASERAVIAKGRAFATRRAVRLETFMARWVAVLTRSGVAYT